MATRRTSTPVREGSLRQPYLLPLEILLAISLPIWGELLAALDPKAPSSSHERIERHLLKGASPALADALSLLEAFAVPAGRLSIEKASIALGITPVLYGKGLSRDLPDADFAAQVIALAAQHDPAAHLDALLSAAATELFRATPWPRMPREFVLRDGVATDAVPAADVITQRLRKELKDVVGVATDAAGGAIFQVRRRVPAPGLVPVDAEGRPLAVPASIIASDTLEWVPSRRLLRIQAADPTRIDLLVEAFGDAAAGDVGLFTHAPTCTLAPLQEKGAAALVAKSLAFDIREVRLTALRWDSGDCDILTLEGRDVFAALETRGWHVLGGRPLGAQLRVVLASGARVSIVLCPPNRVHLPTGARGVLCRQLLDALGLTWTEPPKRAPSRRLWAAEPFIHPAAEWPRFVDGELEALRAMRAPEVIVPHQVRAIAHPDYPDHGRVLVAMPQEEGQDAYGASFDVDVPSRLVRAKELVAERLDVAALATQIARGLGVEGSSGDSVREMEGRGCFSLGRRSFGPATAALTFLPRDPGPQGASLFALLALRAEGHTPLLLTPPGCRAKTDLRQVEMPRLSPPYDETLAAIVRALGVEDDVAAHLVAPKDAVLVIDAGRGEVYFDGVRVGRATELHVRLFLLLAEGKALSGKQIGVALKHRTSAESAISNLVGRVVEAVRHAAEVSGRRSAIALAERVIVHERGGYRLGVAAFVRR